MATIVSTDMKGSGAKTVTETTLTASDTFTYQPRTNQLLYLKNNTGGALTVVIDGDGATTVGVDGVGSIDISSGYSTESIADGVTMAIPLDTIRKYLKGTIAVTGGTGIIASLLTF